jgi:hypothetical protein
MICCFGGEPSARPITGIPVRDQIEDKYQPYLTVLPGPSTVLPQTWCISESMHYYHMQYYNFDCTILYGFNKK